MNADVHNGMCIVLEYTNPAIYVIQKTTMLIPLILPSLHTVFSPMAGPYPFSQHSSQLGFFLLTIDIGLTRMRLEMLADIIPVSIIGTEKIEAIGLY